METLMHSDDSPRRIIDLEKQLRQAQQKLLDNQELFEKQLQEHQNRLDNALPDQVEEQTRILVLKKNPEAEAMEAKKGLIEALKAENASLRASQGQIPQASVHALQKELETLQQTLEAKETRILRLKQVFSAKVAQYLEAVTEILGFRLEVGDDGIAKLVSLYNTPQDPTITYCLTGSQRGHVELVGGTPERVHRLQSMIKDWIDRGSLPALMASITLGLYQLKAT